MNATAKPVQKATKDDVAELTAIKKVTFPHEEACGERDPFVVTLATGLELIIWTPLAAAVELETLGHAVRAASESDLLADAMRAQKLADEADFTPIECAHCTRFDRCGNHEQHGVGCHCLYRGDFFRSFAEGAVTILCVGHKHFGNPAATVKIEFI